MYAYGTPFSKECGFCGCRFTAPQNRTSYCSKECSAKAASRARGEGGSVETRCGVCKKVFADFKSNNRMFCSSVCRIKARKKPRPACLLCGRPVRLMRNRYCSKRCSNLSRPKPGTASWMGFYQRAQRANPRPKPCGVCGAPGVVRHHEDYTKTEEVWWLCRTCHQHEHHRGRKRGQRDRPSAPPVLPPDV